VKDFVLEIAATKMGYNQKLNTMREYLQSYILRIMHNSGVFRYTAFLGGTALRFLYHLPRFSEDLDFSIEGNISHNFTDLVKKIKQELKLAGYKVLLSGCSRWKFD
jgi:predicted nucleotidyltransferase component of viral defense system